MILFFECNILLHARTGNKLLKYTLQFEYRYVRSSGMFEENNEGICAGQLNVGKEGVWGFFVQADLERAKKRGIETDFSFSRGFNREVLVIFPPPPTE